MKKSYLRFYLIMLGILLTLSAYPVVMGMRIVFLQLVNGSIRAEDYARYVIPYTAICLAILIVAALHPVLARLGRRSAPAAALLALGLFTGIELAMESITIKSAAAQSALQWQLLSCVYTPKAVMAFQGAYDDSFKIHYFLVSFVLIALVTSVVYGYGNRFAGGAQADRRPVHLQAAAAVLLLVLCVFANITGFFRQPVEIQSALPALLTGAFFITLGASAGIYTGSFLIGRNRLLSVWLPAAAAVAVCSLMYWGEYLMLGDLYRFGQSFFFAGLPGIVLAPADVLVALLSGGVTALALALVRYRSTACRTASIS